MNISKKILVIEDDFIQSRILQNILRQNAYDVFEANTGARGIELALKIKPDLILCDVNMEPLNGFQVYDILNDSLMIDSVPFIFITGNSSLNDVRAGMNLGADDYFIKPVDKDALIFGIEKRLSRFIRMKDIGQKKFNALFNLSPNGIFMFDNNSIIEANPAFLKTTGIEQEKLSSYKLTDILTKSAYDAIRERLDRCSKGLISQFFETVCLRIKDKELPGIEMYITHYEKNAFHSLMQGLIILGAKNKYEKVLNPFLYGNLPNNGMDSKKNKTIRNSSSFDIQMEIKDSIDFFSKREIEVLTLSLNGLPMKMIADQLSISARTVEKHRANLMEKTNSKNMIEVIVFALRNNLIEI